MSSVALKYITIKLPCTKRGSFKTNCIFIIYFWTDSLYMLLPVWAELTELTASKKRQDTELCPVFLEAPPGFGPGVEVLQTFALPLGHGAIFA